jgi:hypothetical protein
MDQAARVRSTDSIREFRASLLEFSHDLRDALSSVDLETRRALEWILERQPAYWQHQVRVGHDRVLAAKNDLHRCRSSPLPGGGVPSCMEERKALERAQRRLAYAEEKVLKVRQWGHTSQQEITEYAGRANQLVAVLDGDLPRAVEFLNRVLSSLESYLAVGGSVDQGVVGMARGGTTPPTGAASTGRTESDHVKAATIPISNPAAMPPESEGGPRDAGR